MFRMTLRRTYLPVFGAVLLLFLALAPASMATVGPTFVEQARLLPADVGDEEHFGSAVAVDGDTAVVGHSPDDHAGERSGSANVFVRSGAAWSEQAKLTASDAAAFDMFGGEVAIAGDTVVVGRYSDPRSQKPGSAYVFVRSGTAWTEQARLTASDGAVSDGFGFSVAIEGDTAVIGTFDRERAGSAYVFVRSGTSWSEQAKLTAPSAVVDDHFGFSVAIEGHTVVVGARNEDSAGLSAGSAYVFERSGTTWSQQARLTASDAAEWDQFGEAVGISGATVAVTAPGNWGDGFDGAAYVFVRDSGSWSEQAVLRQTGFFGDSVAIEGDTVAVGAPLEGRMSGAAFVFTRSGTTWTEQAKLTGSEAGDYAVLGVSVAISGETVAIAGAGSSLGSGEDAVIYPGGAYVHAAVGPCTITGTEGSDHLRGTPGDDVICGLGGDDTLEGMGGDDTLIGGAGQDILAGNYGNDAIFGDAGDDTLYGGPGNDLLSGNGDSDRLSGGTGNDYLYGADGADSLRGDRGNDDLRGGHGADNIEGRAGSDTLRGGTGDDLLSGNPGDDLLFGGKGEDTLIGGPGSDQLIGGADADILRGRDGDDELHGLAGADTLIGGGGDDLLTGGDGDDFIEGRSGDDDLFGGAGADLLAGNRGDDTVLGAEGDDVIYGGPGVDTCDGGPGDNTVINCE